MRCLLLAGLVAAGWSLPSCVALAPTGGSGDQYELLDVGIEFSGALDAAAFAGLRGLATALRCTRDAFGAICTGALIAVLPSLAERRRDMMNQYSQYSCVASVQFLLQSVGVELEVETLTCGDLVP